MSQRCEQCGSELEPVLGICAACYARPPGLHRSGSSETVERSFEGLELMLLRRKPWPIVGIWVAFGLLTLWTAEVTKSGLRWESHDRARGSLPATVSEDAQEVLAPAIERQLARQSAMRGLLQRASGSPGPRLR